MFDPRSFLKNKIPFEQVLYWTNWLESLENPNRQLMLPNMASEEMRKKNEELTDKEPN